MTFIFSLLLLVIILACAGWLYPEGMWSNAVRLINVVFSGLIATNYYEPLAKLLEDQAASFTFFWDYLAIWALFCVSMIVFHLLTKTISQVKVRFLKIADQIGGGVLAALVGYVLVCFTTMTMHLAPMGRTFFFDGFDPMTSKLLGMNPDVQWLAFTHWVSGGAYSADNEFDPGGDFVRKYASRRDKVEEYRTSKKAFRVGDGELPSVSP
jgi:uncharacterized membrane protein required for colicin V production